MANNSVDAILQRLITDAKNLNPDIDISQGTETYVRFSATASALWGAYKHLDWTLDQIFPTSMSQESLETFAGNRGISIDSMTPAELLAYVVSRLRKPPAGGKARDYERWALEASSTGAVYPVAPGMLSSSVTAFSPVDLLDPHSAEIGLRLDESHVGQIVLTADLGAAQVIFGIGLGTYTSRLGVFELESADDPLDTWVVRATITAGYWWRMSEFDAVTARHWRLRLVSLSPLIAGSQPEWHNLTLFGMEFYASSTTIEKATSAKALMNYYGTGTLLTLLQPSTLSMRLCETARTNQNAQGPVAPKDLRVQVPIETVLNLRVVLVGTLSSVQAFRTSIAQYIASLEPGSLFITAQIVVFAMEQGAVNAVPWVQKSGGEWVEYPQMISPSSIEKFVMGSLELL